MGEARLDVSREGMDICRIDAKEEFLEALALETRLGQAALLDRISRDPLAVALPAVSIWALPQGPYLWVAASLFFSLLYPALLLLPAFRRRNPAPRQHAYLRTLRSLGILGQGSKIGYLAGNAFVIGPGGVTPAFSCFAVVNLGVALAWVLASPPSRALEIVIVTLSRPSMELSTLCLQNIVIGPLWRKTGFETTSWSSCSSSSARFSTLFSLSAKCYPERHVQPRLGRSRGRQCDDGG